MSLQFVFYIFRTHYIQLTALNKLNKRNMTTNKRNEDRTGQLSTHDIICQTAVTVTQFIQK